MGILILENFKDGFKGLVTEEDYLTFLKILNQDLQTMLFEIKGLSEKIKKEL